MSYRFMLIDLLVLFNYNKINSRIDVFLRNFETFAINCFCNVFIYVEELNYLKDCMNVMRKARANYIEN